MPGVFVVAGMAGVLVLFVVATMLVVTGVLSSAVRPVQVVRCVGRSMIGVAQFTNALLDDLGGVIPFRMVPGVLVSVVIVTHSVLLDLGTPGNASGIPILFPPPRTRQATSGLAMSRWISVGPYVRA
jgi:hypothetical protein